MAARLLLAEPIHTAFWAQTVNAVLFNTFCLASLLCGTAFFHPHVNQSRPLWSRLTNNSYGIYYLHPLFLYPLAYLLLSAPVSIFIKAPVLILLTLLLSWAGSVFVLQKLPGIRVAFRDPSVRS